MTEKTSKACVVLVTCSSTEEAEKIAKIVVTEQLVACVNIIGEKNSLRSLHIWENSLQNEAEQLLVMKTFISKLPALETRIKELHSYSVPEFIALPIVYASQNYIQWMTQSIK